MTDLELIAGCKKSNPEAQHRLYKEYAPRMMSVCLRYVNDQATAEDILQDGFVKVFTKIDSYSGEGSFAGWMRKIFVTTSLDYLRKNGCLKQSVPLEESGPVEDEINIPVLSRLSAEELLACIARLPAGYRTIFNLYAIEGYSHSEIAQMMNIKESSSQSQLTRARRLLQKNVMSIIGKDHAK